MKTLHVSRLMSLALLASLVLALPAPAAPSVEQQVKAARAELLKGKARPRAAEEVAVYRELRARPQFATNRAARVYLTDQIVRLCGKPGMHTVSRWDKKLMDDVPGEAKLVLDDASCTIREKMPFAWYLATYLASEKEDYAAAEKALDDLLAAFPKAKPFDKALIELNRVTLYRWQDRYEDAFRVLEERVAPADARRAAESASALAGDTGEWAKASAFWKKVGDESAELGYYAGKRDRFGNQPGPKDCRARAKAYVENTANPIQRRADLVLGYFCEQSTDEERALRASVKEADFTGGWTAERKLQQAIQYDDFELALELMDLFKARTRWNGFYKTKTVQNRVKMVCLGAVGRKDEAAALAAAAAEEKDVAPIDAVKFRVSEALLKGQDPAPVVAAAKLAPADAAKVWRTASRQALLWKDSAMSEKCAAEFEKLHADFPKRALKVSWSDETIGGVADWRKIAPKLDRQFADLKFRMSIEDLVTDVATGGGRSPIEASALDSDDARMELSAVCDKKGVHIFLRVEDPNARAVEAGFASGIGGEFYFAPGPDRPYVCFGASPKDGFQRYAFVTAYEHLGYMRPNLRNERSDIEGIDFEVQFTDADYVEHLFFPWSNYFTDLPTDGRPWRFECVTWAPKGAYTWAGSQGPHEMMGWGDLVFSLTPAQTTAIRRELLYRTRGKWRKAGALDVFEKWADAEAGDPAFYAACLKPLEKELADAMSGVKPEMTDAEVNRIFDQALVKCRGLKHEIDALRRRWLLGKLADGQ